MSKKKKDKRQGNGVVRKVIRKTGGGLFLISAAIALGLGAANQLITWGKQAGDFRFSTLTMDGGFVWDSSVEVAVFGCVTLMIIGLGIYGATLKENE